MTAMSDEVRTVYGTWGRYRCRIETRTTRRGNFRWRYVIEREFAGVTEDETRGRWRRDKYRAIRDGECRLNSYDVSALRKGEYL